MFGSLAGLFGRVRRAWLAAFGVLAVLTVATAAPDAAYAQDVRWSSTARNAIRSNGVIYPGSAAVSKHTFNGRRVVYVDIPVTADQPLHTANLKFEMGGDSGKAFEIFVYDGPITESVDTYQAMLAAPAIYSGTSNGWQVTASLSGALARINELAETGGGVLTVGFRSNETDDFSFTVSNLAIEGVRNVLPVVTGVYVDAAVAGRTAHITGSGFTSAATVWFGGVRAVVISGDDANLYVTVPNNTGAVDVQVRTVVGPSDTSGPADDFTYLPPPATPVIVSPASNEVLNTLTFPISGTAGPGDEVRIQVHNGPPWVARADVMVTADASGEWSHEVTVPMSAGYRVIAQVDTIAGSSSALTMISVAAPPVVTSVTPASAPSEGGTVVVITGLNFRTVTSVRFGGIPAASFTVDSNLQITAVAPPGTGTVDVRVTNLNGESDTSGPGDDFTYVAPLSISIRDAEGAEGSMLWFETQLSGPAPEGGVSYTVSTQDGTAVRDEDFNASSQNLVIPEGQTGMFFGVWLHSDALTEGDETFFVNLTNVTGAVIADAQATGVIFDVPAPELSLGDVSVAEGDSGVTTIVVPVDLSTPAPLEGVVIQYELADVTASRLEGDYIHDVVPVLEILGGQSHGEIAIQIVGDTRFEPDETFLVRVVEVQRAALAKGQATVTILNDDPQPAPTVASLSPASAYVGQNLTVTIGGSGFTGATEVRFGDVAASGLTVVNDHNLIVVAPAMPGGVVDVIVTGPGGVSDGAGVADDFRFIGQPVVSDVSPREGLITGGEEITVTGENLTGVTRVWFVSSTGGYVPDDSFTVDSDTQLRVIAPGRPDVFYDGELFDIVPQNPAGQADRQAGPADDYRQIAGPLVTSIDVEQGSTSGGTRVTLTGTHLAAVTGVTVGGVPATNLVVGESTIAFDTPAGLGWGQIEFDWPFGSIDTGLRFQFIPPTPTITSAPPLRTNATTASFAVSGDDLRYNLDGGSPMLVTDQPLVVSDLTEGEHVIGFWSMTGGNASYVAVHRWTVDLTPPAPPSLSTPAPGAVLWEIPAQLAGSAEAGATVSVRVDDVHLGDTQADIGGVWAMAVSAALEHGEHTVVLTARDEAGNASSESAPFTFTLDLNPPAAPTITSPTEGAALLYARPFMEGEAQVGATVVIAIDGAAVGGATANPAGRWAFTPGVDLADGVHTVTATAYDAYGRGGPASAPRAFSVDTIRPDAPVISEPTDGEVIASRTPTLRGQAEADAFVEVFLANMYVGQTEADGSGAWSFVIPTPLMDGRHTIQVRARDRAGNRSEASENVDFVLDATAPLAPVLGSPAMGELLPASPTQVTGTAEPGSTVSVHIDDAHIGDAAVDASGLWALPVTDELGHGLHLIVLTARDAVGNVSPQAGPYGFTVDLSVPEAPVISSPAEGAALADARPTFQGDGQAGTSVTLSIDGAPVGDAIVDGAGRWTFTPAADLAEGAHTVSAVARDGFGRVGPQSAVLNFSIDTLAPDVPILAEPAAGSVIASRTPTLRGLAEAGAQVTVRLDGAVIGAVAADGSGAWSLAVPTPLADGPHAVRLEAVDALMNRSGLSAEVVFSVDATAPAAPTITSPGEGAVLRTATPTFVGSAEPQAVLLVTLDGAPAGEATADAAGAWSFTAPAVAPGDHTLEVVARDAVGNLSPAASVAFTYVALTLADETLPQGQVAQVYATSLSADGGHGPYVYAVTGGALPAGLRLTAAGDLEGEPSESGAFVFTITVTDADGLTAAGIFRLTIAPPAEPDASDVTDVDVDLDGAEGGSIDLSAAVSNAAYIEIVTPPDHGVATIDGFEIRYAPVPGYFGPDSFTYRAVGYADAGAAPVSRTATVTLTIAPPSLTLAGGTLPAAASGAAYEHGFAADGGTAPFAYAVTAGALPDGLSLSAAGRLTGVPTQGGAFAFTVTATDSSTGVGPFSVSADYSLSVGAPVVTLTPAALPAATVGQAYEQPLHAGGGVAPYAYAVTGGALPAGLSLSAGGVLSGAPTAGGAFEVTVTVTDSSTGAGPYASDHVLGLTVAAAAVTVSPGELPVATRGVAFAAGLSADGGVAPYVFSLDDGALPDGVSLSADGALSGTPTETGRFEFTVRATDSATGEGPYSGVRALTLEVDAAAISVTPTELPGVLAGVPYSQALSASGGIGEYAFAISAGALPEGLTLSPAGLISGRATTGGDHAFTVTATDSYGNTGSAALTIAVTARPDPSIDPDVRGLNLAQAEAVRRMARTQLDNFNRRLERLRSGQAGSDMGLSLNAQAFAPLDMERAVPGLSPMRQGMGAAPEVSPDAADAARHFGADAAPSATRSGQDGASRGPRDENGRVRLWAGGAITLGERDPTTNESELSISTTGISLGADFSLGDRLDVGAGLGFGQERTDVGVDGSRLEAETWAGVAYGSFRPVDGVFVDGVLGYSQLSFDMRRRTPVAADMVFGDREGSAWFGSLRAGIDRGGEDLRWSAFGGVELVDADLDAFAERGSATEALAFAARRVESLQGVWGLRFERELDGPGGRWSPGARLEWRHEFGEGGSQMIRYADWLDGPAYEIGQAVWDRNELTLGLSLVVRTYRGWSITAEHDARLSQNQTTNGYRLEVSRTF